ncbi:hypothetical protein MMPV_009344 [Pyropia vietnamensis]
MSSRGGLRGGPARMGAAAGAGGRLYGGGGNGASGVRGGSGGGGSDRGRPAAAAGDAMPVPLHALVYRDSYANYAGGGGGGAGGGGGIGNSTGVGGGGGGSGASAGAGFFGATSSASKPYGAQLPYVAAAGDNGSSGGGAAAEDVVRRRTSYGSDSGSDDGLASSASDDSYGPASSDGAYESDDGGAATGRVGGPAAADAGSKGGVRARARTPVAAAMDSVGVAASVHGSGSGGSGAQVHHLFDAAAESDYDSESDGVPTPPQPPKRGVVVMITAASPRPPPPPSPVVLRGAPPRPGLDASHVLGGGGDRGVAMPVPVITAAPSRRAESPAAPVSPATAAAATASPLMPAGRSSLHDLSTTRSAEAVSPSRAAAAPARSSVPVLRGAPPRPGLTASAVLGVKAGGKAAEADPPPPVPVPSTAGSVAKPKVVVSRGAPPRPGLSVASVMAPALTAADVVRGGDNERSGGSNVTDRDGSSASSQSPEQLASPAGGGGSASNSGSGTVLNGAGRRRVGHSPGAGQPASLAAPVPVPVPVTVEPPPPRRPTDSVAALTPGAARLLPGAASAAAAAATTAAVADSAASDDDTSSWETCSDSDEERESSSRSRVSSMSRASCVPPVAAIVPKLAAEAVVASTTATTPVKARSVAAAVAHGAANNDGGSSPLTAARPSKAKSAHPAEAVTTARTTDELAKAKPCSPGVPAEANSTGRGSLAPPVSTGIGTAVDVVAAAVTEGAPVPVKTKSERHDGAPTLPPTLSAARTTSGAARSCVPALPMGAGDTAAHCLDTLGSASPSMAIEPAVSEAADFVTSARSRVSGSNVSIGPPSMGFDRSAASERPSARLSGRSGRLSPLVNVPAGVGGGEDGGGGGVTGAAAPAATLAAGGGSSAPVGRSRNPVGRMLSFSKDKGSAGGAKAARASDSKVDGGKPADPPPHRSSNPMGRLVSFNRTRDGKRGSQDEEKDGAPAAGGGGKASGHGGGIIGLARSISMRRDKESSRRKQKEKDKEEAAAAAAAATSVSGLDSLGVTSPVSSRASDGPRSTLISPTDVASGMRSTRGGLKEFDADVDDELDAVPPSRRASERATKEGMASRPSGRLLSFRGGKKEARGGKEDGGALAKEEEKKSRSRSTVSGLVKSVSRRKDKNGETKPGGRLPGSVTSPVGSSGVQSLTSCRSPTGDGLSWAELNTSEVKKAAHLDVAVRAPVLIPAPYSGPASKSNWHVNFLTMPHNALRREMSDLYELLLAMVDFGAGLRKADFRDLRTWWHVFSRFLHDWLDIERRLLFPWVNATGVHDWELQSTLRELRATKEFLDMKLEELAIYLDGFESLPPTEMFSLLYKSVDALAPRLMGYFNTQERVFPAAIRATYVADDAVRLEKEMVDALLNGSSGGSAAASASKASSSGSGADSLCALSRGVTDPKHLKVWVQRNLSATSRLSYNKWVKHFNETHRGVVRNFRERVPKATA